MSGNADLWGRAKDYGLGSSEKQIKIRGSETSWRLVEWLKLSFGMRNRVIIRVHLKSSHEIQGWVDTGKG